MPINPIRPCDLQSGPQYLPLDVRPDDNLSTPVLISQEEPDIIPDNFDQLPPEEQERIKNRIRFRGIRCRSDDKTSTVQLTRKTMDIP